jgi:hypothetical protein
MVDLRDPATPVAAVVRALGLSPHPEGGHYRETWRDRPADGGRGAGTAILFLLAEGEVSHWHRVDAAELWIWQAGAPLLLEVSEDGRTIVRATLGPSLDEGQGGCKGWCRRARGNRAWPGGVDAGDLRGGAGVSVRGVRDGGSGLGAA